MTGTQAVIRLLRSPLFLIYALCAAGTIVIVMNISFWLLLILLPIHGVLMGLVMANVFREP
jgi:hypothetical protein